MQYKKELVDFEEMFRNFHYIEQFSRDTRLNLILDFPTVAHYHNLDSEDTFNLKRLLKNNNNISKNTRKEIFRHILTEWFTVYENRPISDEIAKELIDLHYYYDFYHPLGILQNKLYFNYFIREIGFKFFFVCDKRNIIKDKHNAKFRLNDNIVNMLVSKMQECNYEFIALDNDELLKYSKIREYFENKYQIDSFNNNYKEFSSINRAIKKGYFNYFSEQEITCIKENMLEYCDYIDLDYIIKTITPDVFGTLYHKLAEKENIINKNFNIEHFRKVMYYLQNNMHLLPYLKYLNEELTNNFVCAMNLNWHVSIDELKNFESVFRNRIRSDKLKNQLCMLLVGKNSDEVKSFLQNIISKPKLAELLLEFEKSEEIEYLSKMFCIVNFLEKIVNDDYDEKFINYILLNKSLPNYFYNLDVITKNLQDVFAKLYVNYSLFNSKSDDNKECEIVLDGSLDFSIFVHDLGFRDYNRDDFTESYETSYCNVKNNYICTQYLGRFSNIMTDLNDNRYMIFKMDLNGLITFGNKDVGIIHTFGSCYQADKVLMTPLEMMFNIENNSYSTNEFDFLRVNNNGENFVNIYGYHQKIKIDREKLLENNLKLFEIYYANIDKLNWKEMYIMLGMFQKLIKKPEYMEKLNDVKYQIMERISEMQELEQVVLFNVIDRLEITALKNMACNYKIKKYNIDII